ncbi:hypothetical protein FNH13_03485 [Ornithinimicrobium ciconiae]|uniref:DUF998 domain-containing protein n=1 Tax=Ornithinimicrobium ciconiae TaxID=2594265 RepID=A0A516G7L1_9MICO|nr:hypothetical protein [Ornithinimicrobium ciconiae]QDO87513.1 hypothetical protein FNH13_03485 [Ornithinimicrobium ciconiae]
MSQLARVTAACAVVAGLSWTAAAVLHSLQPPGCVGEACAVSGPMRGSTPTTDVLLLIAGTMLAASLVGLALLARRRGGGGRVGFTGMVASGLGLALFLAAGAVSTIGDSDWSGMPFLVMPGLGLLVLGLLLVATSVWRGDVLPRGLSVVVVLSVLLLPLANEQTSQVLLAVPFGLAWAGLGVVLLRTRGATVLGAASSTDLGAPGPPDLGSAGSPA